MRACWKTRETVDINEDFPSRICLRKAKTPLLSRRSTPFLRRLLRAGASDIHIEPYRDVSRVRYRLDGVLYERHAIQKAHHAAIVSRIKGYGQAGHSGEKDCRRTAGSLFLSEGGRQACACPLYPLLLAKGVVLEGFWKKNERIPFSWRAWPGAGGL